MSLLFVPRGVLAAAVVVCLLVLQFHSIRPVSADLNALARKLNINLYRQTHDTGSLCFMYASNILKQELDFDRASTTKLTKFIEKSTGKSLAKYETVGQQEVIKFPEDVYQRVGPHHCVWFDEVFPFTGLRAGDKYAPVDVRNRYPSAKFKYWIKLVPNKKASGFSIENPAGKESAQLVDGMHAQMANVLFHGYMVTLNCPNDVWTHQSVVLHKLEIQDHPTDASKQVTVDHYFFLDPGMPLIDIELEDTWKDCTKTPTNAEVKGLKRVPYTYDTPKTLDDILEYDCDKMAKLGIDAMKFISSHYLGSGDAGRKNVIKFLEDLTHFGPEGNKWELQNSACSRLMSLRPVFEMTARQKKNWFVKQSLSVEMLPAYGIGALRETYLADYAWINGFQNAATKAPRGFWKWKEDKNQFRLDNTCRTLTTTVCWAGYTVKDGAKQNPEDWSDAEVKTAFVAEKNRRDGKCGSCQFAPAKASVDAPLLAWPMTHISHHWLLVGVVIAVACAWCGMCVVGAGIGWALRYVRETKDSTP